MLDLLFFQIRGAILIRIRHLRTEQQNEPAKVESNHENRHQAKATVYFTVGNDAGNVEHADDVVEMKERATHQAPYQRRPPMHLGVRHQQIQKRERKTHDDEWKEELI